jgi:hypothetical protein
MKDNAAMAMAIDQYAALMRLRFEAYAGLN